MSGCATIDPDRVDEALATLNYDLQDPAFGTTSQVKFEKVGVCEVVHDNIWMPETARKKGYSRAVTSTPFKLRDVVAMEHLPTHEEHYRDHSEHWGDHIRIELRRPVKASFTHTTLDGAQTETNTYDSAFVTIDTLRARPAQIADMLEELRAAITLCRGLKAAKQGADVR